MCIECQNRCTGLEASVTFTASHTLLNYRPPEFLLHDNVMIYVNKLMYFSDESDGLLTKQVIFLIYLFCIHNEQID